MLPDLPVLCAEVFEAHAVPGYQLCADYIIGKKKLCIYVLPIYQIDLCVQAFDVRDDITKLKEDLSSLKEEVAKLVQALKSRVEAAGSNK